MNFDEEVAARKAFVSANHPLMDRPEPKAANIIIPREVALANAKDELQFHLLCAGKWRAEVERLGDME
jgi:hypothetical protein